MNFLKECFLFAFITTIIGLSVFAYEPFVWFLRNKLQSNTLVLAIEITAFIFLISILLFVTYFIYPTFFLWWWQ